MHNLINKSHLLTYFMHKDKKMLKYTSSLKDEHTFMQMKRVYIFDEKQNPSTDYYLIPAFKIFGISASRVNIWRDEYPEIEGGDWICVVRYLNKRLVKFLRRNRKKIERLIYFMDDGLWDLWALKDLPVKYALRIFKKAYLYKRVLKDLDAEIWVSTDYLREKYKDHKPKVVYPYPLNIVEKPSIEGMPYVVFYHGTSSHKREIKWLSHVVEELSFTSTQSLFEIILDRDNIKYFKGSKNIISLRPLGWEGYLKFSALRYRTIGLVPLFDYEFNRGRSWIKFFDITRSGAIGIYSEYAPYARLIREFQSGVVLPMEPEPWVKAILGLLKDEEKRMGLYKNALHLVEYLKNKAEDSYRKAISEK